MINVIGCTEDGELLARVKSRTYRVPAEHFFGWVAGFVAAVDDGDEAHNTNVVVMPTPAGADPDKWRAEMEKQMSAPAAPAATEAAPTPATEKPLTVEDVRKAFKELEANGVERSTITAAIKRYGKTLPEVPADKLQELLDEVRKCG